MHSAIRRDDAGDRSGGRRRDGGIEQNEMNPLSTYHNTAVGANLNFDFMQQYVWGFWTRSNEKGSSKFMKTFTDGSDQAPRGALLSPVAAGVNTKQGRSLSLSFPHSLLSLPLSLSLSLRVSKRGVTVHAYMEHASAPPSPPPLPPEHGIPLEMRAGSGGGIAGPRGAKAERATTTKYLGYFDENQGCRKD